MVFDSILKRKKSTPSFGDFGLSQETLTALEKKGFEEPSPIQAATIPLLLKEEKDIVGQAQTGTGKTAAFGIPLVEKIKEKTGHVQALVLAPTRELAIQVTEEITSFIPERRLHVAPIYGGQSIDLQLRRIRRGVDIVVGTPGRVIDLLNRKNLSFDQLKYMVLDEADEMLNMGFIDDLEEILRFTPDSKRVFLFSATMPPKILNLAKKYMGDYDVVKVKQEQLTTALTDQIYFEVRESNKFDALCRIIDIEPEFYGLIFCRTKNDTDRIASKLLDRDYDVEALHGDISQYQRERILKKFKSQQLNILVATDVAARGIDVDNLTHVINYSLPQDPEAYVHRIGRTGRAGKEGTAITFVTPEEYRKLLLIKRITKTDIRKENLPEVSDIMVAKRTRLKQNITDAIEEGLTDTYTQLAGELLESGSAQETVAALLKLTYEDDFNESQYRNIQDVKVDRSGTARLFVALGRKHGYNHPKNLAQFIQDETEVPSRKIQGIRIFDDFSFITVHFEEAELILEVFKQKRKGRKSLVEKAKGGAPSGREFRPPQNRNRRPKRY